MSARLRENYGASYLVKFAQLVLKFDSLLQTLEAPWVVDVSTYDKLKNHFPWY